MLAAAAVLIWAIFEQAGLDRAVMALAYDPALGRFPLQHSYALNAFGHVGLKWTMLGLWAACALWRPLRRGAIYMAVAAIAVTLLKQASAHSCPWDLADYGGTAAWYPLLADIPANAGPGRCLPAGHPVTGFMLFGLYLAIRPTRPALARAALVVACVIGIAAGAVQVARGAHFPSHVLWSAWVAWVATLAADALGRRLWARRMNRCLNVDRPAPSGQRNF